MTVKILNYLKKYSNSIRKTKHTKNNLNINFSKKKIILYLNVYKS